MSSSISSPSSSSNSSSINARDQLDQNEKFNENYKYHQIYDQSLSPTSPLQRVKIPFARSITPPSRRARTAARVGIVCILLVVLGSAGREWVCENEGGCLGTMGYVGGGSVLRVEGMGVTMGAGEGEQFGQGGGFMRGGEEVVNVMDFEPNVIVEVEEEKGEVQEIDDLIHTHASTNEKGVMRVADKDTMQIMLSDEEKHKESGNSGMLGNMEIAWKA